MHDCLFHKLIVGQKAAGQVLLVIEPSQAGALHASCGVSAVTLGAVHLINVASLRLLRVQT